MTGKPVVQGGPADGLPVAPGRKFAWIEVVAVRRSVPTPNAGLYELRGGAYVYIGGHQSACECGAFYRRAEGGAEDQGCPLCGARKAIEG